MMPSIVISYRRTDTDVMVGRVRDRLVDHYGNAAVFIDIDNIPFGTDFRAHISEAVTRSDILLAVVGRRWLGAAKGRQPRIAEDADFVRLEVETALRNRIPVIPLLIGTANMPAPGQLPESLREFAFINAASVDTGRDFHFHLDRLIRSLDQRFLDLENKKAPAAPAELSSARAGEAETDAARPASAFEPQSETPLSEPETDKPAEEPAAELFADTKKSTYYITKSINLVFKCSSLKSANDQPEETIIQGDNRLMEELFGASSSETNWKSVKARFCEFPNSCEANFSVLRESLVQHIACAKTIKFDLFRE